MTVTIVNQQIRVFTVASLEALGPYVEQWDQLALQAPQRLPMLSASWVMTYLEHCLHPHESWKCYLATTPDGRLVGILPLVIMPHPLWGSFFPTLHTPWDWHTRSGDFLANPGLETQIFEAFLVALREEFGSCFTLEMKGLRDNSPTLTVLSQGIAGWVSWTKPEPPGGFIPVDGSFEQFLSKLSPKFKSNLRWAGKKLAQMPGFAMTFSSVSFANFRSLEKFLELEASGWKGKGGTAIACSSGLKAFYRQLARRLADRGWLELHFLESKSKPIAGHFAVRFGSTLVIPKLAYDEAYSKFSPGSVLFERTIERAFGIGDCQEINMLSDTNWFNRWNMEWGGYCHACLFPRHPVPLFLGRMPKIVRTKLAQIQWIVRIYKYLLKFRGG